MKPWYVLLMGGIDAPELVGPFASNEQANDWAITNGGDECCVFDIRTATEPEA